MDDIDSFIYFFEEELRRAADMYREKTDSLNSNDLAGKIIMTLLTHIPEIISGALQRAKNNYDAIHGK